MKTTYTYFKNSNTGDIITRQEFTETRIREIPIYYYRNGRRIGKPDMRGYVEISERKYRRLTKTK